MLNKGAVSQSSSKLQSGGIPLSAPSTLTIPIGVSNRHVHLSRDDLDILFGSGYELTKMKDVKQPGQYAAEEQVTIKGPKREIKNVRVLGPLRPETQIEISMADNYILGTQAPIKMSGDLTDSEEIEIIGPKGSVKKNQGVIVAWRHIHMPLEQAKQFEIEDGQKVSVKIEGIRGGVMDNIIVRATNSSVLELHIDIDEANAYHLGNDSVVTLHLKQ